MITCIALLLIIWACAVVKVNTETGLAKIGPAGPLATAIYDAFTHCTVIILGS